MTTKSEPINVQSLFDLTSGTTQTFISTESGVLTPSQREIALEVQSKLSDVMNGIFFPPLDLSRLTNAVEQRSSHEFISLRPASVSTNDVAGFVTCTKRALAIPEWKELRGKIAAGAAHALLKGDNPQAARELAEIALNEYRRTNDAENVSACLLIAGTCAVKQGQKAEARRCYEQAIASCEGTDSDSKAWAQWNLGSLAFDDGNYSLAGTLWKDAGTTRRAISLANEPVRTWASAASRFEKVDFERALAFWLDALAVAVSEPNTASTRSIKGKLEYEIGRLLFVEMHQPSRAANHLKRSIELLRHAAVEDRGELLSALGALAEILRDHDAAQSQALANERNQLMAELPDSDESVLSTLLQAPTKLDSDPNDSKKIAIYKLIQQAQQKASSAPLDSVTCIDKAVNIALETKKQRDFGTICLLKTMAADILWAAEKKELALSYQREACEVQPSNIQAQLRLGVFLHNTHQCEEAFAVGLRLTKIMPQSHVGFMMAGMAASRFGDSSKAVVYLEKAVELAPTRQDLQVALQAEKTNRQNAVIGGKPAPALVSESILAAANNLPPTNHEAFRKYLEEFAQRVSANSDGFWKSRASRKWVNNPECHGESLLRQDLRSRGIHHVYSQPAIPGGRIDLIVNVHGSEFVVELKICGAGYSKSYAEGGFEQLKTYMKSRNTSVGYLVVFDGRTHQDGSDKILQIHSDADGTRIYCISANVLGMATSKVNARKSKLTTESKNGRRQRSKPKASNL